MKKYLIFVFSAFIVSVIGACTSSGEKVITKTLPPSQFQKMLEKEHGILIDVRTESEYEESHIDGAVNFNIDGDHFRAQIDTLDKNKAYFVYCRSGKRSARAMEIMKEAGFKKLYNLDGGILEWRKNNLPVIKSEKLNTVPAWEKK